LTKVHQQFLRGTSAEVAEQMHHPRGEFTVVIGPQVDRAPAISMAADEDILREFSQMTDIKSRREAIHGVAVKLGASARQVYAAVERARSKSVK
jgi:16S rRNA C1402 (ribose-2'-O) methylase RsmI